MLRNVLVILLVLALLGGVGGPYIHSGFSNGYGGGWAANGGIIIILIVVLVTMGVG